MSVSSRPTCAERHAYAGERRCFGRSPSSRVKPICAIPSQISNGTISNIACSAGPAPRAYGVLEPDPAGFLDLPRGFSYRVISSFGDRMDDGFVVPVHFLGAAALSFAQGVKTQEGDVFEIEAEPFFLPLRNSLGKSASAAEVRPLYR